MDSVASRPWPGAAVSKAIRVTRLIVLLLLQAANVQENKPSDTPCAHRARKTTWLLDMAQSTTRLSQALATGHEEAQATATGQEEKSAAASDNEQAIAETPSAGIGK